MKPNIIFILLDGSRWDRLDVSSDFIELKKKGILLNNVSAAYPYTFAAMNSIFTGLHGKENGVNAYYKMFRLNHDVDFLPELLQQNGYFTSCDLISEKVISKRGFDIHQSHDEYQDDLFSKHSDLIKKSFFNDEQKPFFTFLQFSKIHTATVSEVLKKYDWDDPIFYKNKKDNLQNYDDAFNQAGKYATKIFDFITNLGILDNTYIIFFADHGTGNGERFGERNYGIYLYEETIRTYYLFIGPQLKANFTCSKLFSTLQIFSTFLDLSMSKNNSHQKSLLPYIKSPSMRFDEIEFTFSETGGLQGPFPSPETPNVFCIKNSKFKLIYYKSNNSFELFNLDDDPEEKTNLYGKTIAIENILKTKLFEWINR